MFEEDWKEKYLVEKIENSEFRCKLVLRYLVNSHYLIDDFTEKKRVLEVPLRAGNKKSILPGRSLNLDRSLEQYLGVLGKYFLKKADEFANIEEKAAREYFKLTGKNPYIVSQQ